MLEYAFICYRFTNKSYIIGTLHNTIIESISQAMENDQWAYMEERCIVVDDHDNQIGEGSKKDCILSIAMLSRSPSK